MNDEQQPQKRGPGRPRKHAIVKESPRVEEEKAERRRRNVDGIQGKRRRLAVNIEMDPNYEYRWINDVGNRVRDLTELDDWDIVQEKDPQNDGRTRHVGEDDRGASIRAVLVRKRKDYYKQDLAAKRERIDETEKAMKADKGGSSDENRAYTPEGGVQITHGSRA